MKKSLHFSAELFNIFVNFFLLLYLFILKKYDDLVVELELLINLGEETFFSEDVEKLHLIYRG